MWIVFWSKLVYSLLLKAAALEIRKSKKKVSMTALDPQGLNR